MKRRNGVRNALAGQDIDIVNIPVIHTAIKRSDAIEGVSCSLGNAKTASIEDLIDGRMLDCMLLMNEKKKRS